MELNFTKQLMNELKRVIKEQGYTYSELAIALKMSESGFKKLINSKDCNLSKIENICRVIGIQISDIIQSTEQMQIVQVAFTTKQESFFISNRSGFLLYWLLVYERRNLEESQKTLSFDSKRLWTTLRKLDNLNLIKVHSNNRISLPKPVGVKWVGRTQFVNKVFAEWSHSLLDDILAKRETDPAPESPNAHFGIRYLRMTDSTWTEFKTELESLEVKYTNKATSEMRISSSRLNHVRWITLADQQSWVDAEIRKSI
jgi:DNA-binding Xre family transcriptional regulator